MWSVILREVVISVQHGKQDRVLSEEGALDQFDDLEVNCTVGDYDSALFDKENLVGAFARSLD